MFLPTSQEALTKQLFYLQENPPEILRYKHYDALVEPMIDRGWIDLFYHQFCIIELFEGAVILHRIGIKKIQLTPKSLSTF